MVDAGPKAGNLAQPAGGPSLADRKLQLEIEKLEREKQAAELQAAATGQLLADQKLQLEVEKLNQEKTAYGLTATASSSEGQSKSQLELNKLYSDLLKAKAEADAAITGKTLRVEWFKAWGGLITAAGGLAAAIIAIVTLGSAIQKQSAEDDRRFRADAAGLINSLGDSSEAKRTAAAVALEPYTGNDRTQTFAVRALAYALGSEISPDVQRAIAASLVAAGAPSLDPLKELVSRENANVAAEFDKVGDACAGLPPDRANALTRLRARQTAVILAAESISRIDKARVDLSGAKLKCYPFDGLPEQFDGAKFNDAVLVGGHLYRKKLRNADLSDAEAKGAEFTFADMIGVTVTTKTDFTGALMACITLTGAKGVTPAELAGLLRSAESLEGARLDPEVANQLKDKVNPPDAKPCEY